MKKVTEDYAELRFNTAISQMMMFINDAYKTEVLPKEYVEGFVKMIAPVAPHVAEELWSKLGHSETITYASWPTFDESKLVEDEVEIVVQVMGKVRAKLKTKKDASKEEMEHLAIEAVKEQIEGKTVRKVIVVPGKLVNIVAN